VATKEEKMSDRLPKRDGEWIDRNKPLTFRFEGRMYSGFAGDVVSSALWANGQRMMGRSFKYHRPRGIYSLANHDTNNIVAEGSNTNVRADVTPIQEGMNCTAVNTIGGLESDKGNLIEWFSPFLPVGFYYKAFHNPKKLFPFFERQMRAMAGLGAINKHQPRQRTPKSYSYCDVLVVGAGPAGLSAAIAAADHGAKVIIVDENPHAGGSLGYQWTAEPRAAGIATDLLKKVSSHPNIDLRTSTQAAGYYADHWVALVDKKRLSKARARSVIFATGSYEQPAVFRNNDLPGVMLATGAQRLIYRFRVKPFERSVVLAANTEAYRAALDLQQAGVDVAAIIDLRKEKESSGIAEKLRVPIHQQHAIYECIPGSGKRSILGVIVCPIGVDGNLDIARKIQIDCDGVAMSVGFSPADSLFCQSGGKMTYSEGLSQYIPNTVPKGIFCAGRINGIYDLDDQLLDGTRAGLSALAHLGMYSGSIAPLHHRNESHTHPYPVFEHPKAKNFVDFDEDIQVKDIANAVQEGYDNVELLKRYSTFGMGPSQGKISNTNSIRILSKLKNQSPGQTGSPTARPFFHPVPISHLAGRGFDPHRLTALHSFHESAGAKFIPAGTWLRPGYYAPQNRSREEAIVQEVNAVRQRVGIIDVGTLGKIEINGPDAAQFIERIYTARFAKMKNGTTRYLLMCDESGVVIDDGVAARVSEDRFYVTCTTTGADGVYREMQRWATIWGLNVVLANATGTFAAMNLAGPLSRKILAPLTDVKLEEESFPYLGYREGTVAGVPARLMRVGFVGELGYEIHVPAQSARHVWDTLMKAGAADNIQPFGVEAQRVLRLEKGHIIVGQDTDGLTNPFEAAMDWAIKMDKPFFVGQRSLTILQKKPMKRKLVGFMLAADYNGPTPKECHLVIKDGKTITGRVTSVVTSPSLKRVIGMAYVETDQSEIGKTFTIRIDGGQTVTATVVKIPFYDPDNLRQSEGVKKKEKAAAEVASV
jgi:sarcosine oxidase subunit alpha